MTEQFKTIRYVIYEIQSRRPISQGTCQRRDFPLVVQGLPHGPDGCRAKIMNDRDKVLDLTPYDRVFNDPTLLEGAHGYLAGSLRQGHTAADEITSVDDLDTED